MGCKTAKELHCVTTSEVRNLYVEFSDDLVGSDKLTGTPTIVEVTTSDLTLSNEVVTTATYQSAKGETVAIGAAVSFKVDASEASASTTYTIKITCATDNAVPETLHGEVQISVEA